MKTKLKSIIIVFFLILILYIILIFPKETIDSVLFGLNIWVYNVFPSLFPFFILTDLLANYGFIEFISELFKNFMRTFGLSGNCAFPLFGSLFSGFPSGTKYIKQLLGDETISIEEANLLVMFTHFSNPLFIIGTVGAVLLNNIRLGYLILVAHFSSNFFIGMIFRKKNHLSKEKVSLKKAIYLMNKKRISNKNSFVAIISDSIYNTINILILLLGIIIIFLVFTNFLTLLSINDNVLLFLKGFLELTQGVKMVSISNVDLIYKVILITFFLSFGGCSVHMQVASIINGTKIKYKNFLIARILHSIISIILVCILFFLFN